MKANPIRRLSKSEMKDAFENDFKALEDFISSENLDPRCKAIAITNLQTAKMWAVKGIKKQPKQ